MCGFIGYIGQKSCKSILLEGLRQLEYRGYDSAGMAFIDANTLDIVCMKEAGEVDDLSRSLLSSKNDGAMGIGHTRWATHGPADKIHAHPHFDNKHTLCMVHNGIFHGIDPIRKRLLEKESIFLSSTDTEVGAHLLASLIEEHGSVSVAVQAFLAMVEGSYAFVVMGHAFGDKLLIVKSRAPLVVGIGTNEMFVASDPVGFQGRAHKVIFLPENSFGLMSDHDLEVFDAQGKSLPVLSEQNSVRFQPTCRAGYKHFMLKEIFQQPLVIGTTLEACRRLVLQPGWLDQLRELINPEKLHTIEIIAAGTSRHAGLIAKYFFQHHAWIRVSVHIASEWREDFGFGVGEGTACLFISQSGETADTLEVLRKVKQAGGKAIVLTNMPDSIMSREADLLLLTEAGREVAVASTKAFSTQLVALYWFAHLLGHMRDVIDDGELEDAYQDILGVADDLALSLEKIDDIPVDLLVKKFDSFKRGLFLGRDISHPFALEAALKLKELAYVAVEGGASGELKHGPMALIESGMPIIVFSVIEQAVYALLLVNVQEARARGAYVIAFAFEGQTELIDLVDYAVVLPRVTSLLEPLAMTGLMQLMVYRIAVKMGRSVDKPRNLAKSVTVE